jgi:hypothetical protein
MLEAPEDQISIDLVDFDPYWSELKLFALIEASETRRLRVCVARSKTLIIPSNILEWKGVSDPPPEILERYRCGEWRAANRLP